MLALGASREDGSICGCCLCFRKIFTDVAYVLERFSLILAYVLERFSLILAYVLEIIS